MPPDDDLDPNDDDQPDTPPAENHDLRRLREKAKGADDARAEADAAKRELAFVRAGIDPDDPQQGYFVRGYQGEVSASAIKEAATAAGFLGAAHTSEPPAGITDAERAAFAATQAAAAGSGGPDAPQEDFYAAFKNRSYRSGQSPEAFGIELAQALEAAGEPVAYDGPFREWKGDTGIVPRPGTPFPKRL